MHPGRLHAPDGPDGARKLPFEGAQVIHALHEARGREGVALVEDLVADAPARGQALAGELHADARHVGAGGEDGLAVGAGLVADAAGVEVLHDGARVLGGKLRIEHAHGRLRHAHDHEGEEADERQRDDAHRRDPRRPEPREEVHRPVHV